MEAHNDFENQGVPRSDLWRLRIIISNFKPTRQACGARCLWKFAWRKHTRSHSCRANLFGCPLETILSPDAIDIVVLQLDMPLGGVCSLSGVEEVPACSLSSGGCISPPMSTSSKEESVSNRCFW